MTNQTMTMTAPATKLKHLTYIILAIFFAIVNLSNMMIGDTVNKSSLSSTPPPASMNKTRVFVNYVYSEEGERSDSFKNLHFFLRHGVTAPKNSSVVVDYGLTVNGNCTQELCKNPSNFTSPPNTQGSPRISTIRPFMRTLYQENKGFDFGGHADIFQNMDQDNITQDYDAFIFLNDGVTGPIVPSYMPETWHWTQAFLDRLQGTVGLVGTSIVCLPSKDRGGLGPKVEGFAFALSRDALNLVRQKGTSFREHKNKGDAILLGEYALSKVLLANGFDIDSLLKAYQNMNWRDTKNWNCNLQKHPSRSGSYFGISFNPLEVMFHKSIWKNKLPVSDIEKKAYMEFDNNSKNRQFERTV